MKAGGLPPPPPGSLLLSQHRGMCMLRTFWHSSNTFDFSTRTKSCTHPEGLKLTMAFNSYVPNSVHCTDWKKIWPGYKLKKALDVCPVCNKEATSKCGACHKVAYCSNNCQKLHWKSGHRLQCSLFKIVQPSPGEDGANAGRYLVATRNIDPGEIIIEESPVTVGPKQFTCPVCLGCYRPVTIPPPAATVTATAAPTDDCAENSPPSQPRQEEHEGKCPDCQWPVCGDQDCMDAFNRMHKDTGECELLAKCVLKPKFKENGVSQENPIYECLTPLRCLLVRDLNPDNWRVMMAMEQHTLERQKESFYEVNQTNTVKFLQDHVFNNKEAEHGDDDDNTKTSSSFTDDEINAVVNVLDVNAFEIRGNDFSIRGVYPLTAMMNSVCSPNTQNCIGEDFVCRVRAACPIKKGQEITTTYTLTLAGTFYRRKHLKESKYFECVCKRCSDSTENGTNFSTILCARCTSTDKPALVMSTNPLDFEAEWKCNACGATTPGSEVEELVDVLEKEVSSLPTTKDAYEASLAKYSRILHPNHHVMIDLEFTLVQLYGREKASQKMAEDPKAQEQAMVRDARRKLELCEKVLSVISKLMPGYFRMRGMFLSEMYGIILYLARRDYESNVISDRDFLKKLRHAGGLLDESITILGFEPINTMEGSRCHTAREFRTQLDRLVQGLENKIRSQGGHGRTNRGRGRRQQHR